MELLKEAKILVSEYKKIFKLHGWTFEILESKDKDSAAEVFSFPLEKRAVIKLNLKENGSKKKLKNTIIHELLHLFLIPYSEQIEVDIQFIRDNPKQNLNFNRILNRIVRKEELIVDKLTKILEKLS